MRGRSARRPVMGKKESAAKLARFVQSAGTDAEATKKAEFSARMKSAKANHDALESACVQYAQVKHKIKLMKADSESSFGKNGRLQARRVTTGMPDRIAAIAPTGRFAGFEFKTGQATLRRNQKELHGQLSQSGAAAFVIHSIGEFIETLDALVEHEKAKFQQLAFSNPTREGADHEEAIE